MKDCSYSNVYTTYKLDTGECAKWFFNDLLFNAMSFKMPRFLAIDNSIGKEKIQFMTDVQNILQIEKTKIEKEGVSLDWLQLYEIFEKHNEIVHHLSYVLARVIADPKVYKSIQGSQVKTNQLQKGFTDVTSDTFKTPKYEWSENFNLDLYKRISSLIMLNNELVK
jgi:hypothetical protein